MAVPLSGSCSPALRVASPALAGFTIAYRDGFAALIAAAVHLARFKWLPSLGCSRLYRGANEPLDFEEVEAGGSFAATIGRYTVTAQIYDIIKAPRDPATSSAAAAPPGDTVIYMTVLAIDSLPVVRKRGRRNC